MSQNGRREAEVHESGSGLIRDDVYHDLLTRGSYYPQLRPYDILISKTEENEMRDNAHTLSQNIDSHPIESMQLSATDSHSEDDSEDLNDSSRRSVASTF